LLGVNIVVLLLLMSGCAIIGNISGYWFGKKLGPALFKRENSLLFRKSHLERTQVFYDKHGGKTLILGRFLPIIRTFAPVLAGAIKVDFGKFMLYNLIGAFAWIFSMGLAGFFLGKIPWVEKNVGWIVIFLIVITLLPLLGLRKKRG
jgi:membrane-associated protein